MNKNQNLTTREQLQQKFNTSRMNLLLMMVLTVVNIVLFFAGSESMMLFSATIPYIAVVFGKWLVPSSIATALFILAGILVVAYFVCWLLSKKNYVWMIIALVLFAIDTVALVLLYISFGDFSGILDAVIHAMVLYYLVVGIISGVKLKNMPPEEPEEPQEWPNVEPEQQAE